MTSLLERIVAIIAPHRCINCGNYNNILCADCALAMPNLEVAVCVLCGTPTYNWRICLRCQPTTALNGVWAAVEYAGKIADVMKEFKFSHVREACTPLAACLARALPSFGKDWVVVAVPTTSQHIRQRGYDQAWLLAREIARLKKVPLVHALRRTRHKRQLGATRSVRLEQAKGTFMVPTPLRVAGRRVVVIDDVCTTGATLSAAAEALKKAGAAEVWGAVVAWKLLKQEKR